MKSKATFIVNVLITWLLIVGGMCLAGWLSPSRTVYSILLVACLVPALLFMKFRLPISWYRFGVQLSAMIVMGLILAIFRRFQVEHDLALVIAFGFVILAGSFLNKKKVQND